MFPLSRIHWPAVDAAGATAVTTCKNIVVKRRHTFNYPTLFKEVQLPQNQVELCFLMTSQFTSGCHFTHDSEMYVSISLNLKKTRPPINATQPRKDALASGADSSRPVDEEVGPDANLLARVSPTSRSSFSFLFSSVSKIQNNTRWSVISHQWEHKPPLPSYSLR